MSPSTVAVCAALFTHTAAIVWGGLRLSFFAGQLVTKLDEVDRRSLETKLQLAEFKGQPFTGQPFTGLNHG